MDDHERAIRRLKQALARGGGVADHGALTGLTDDDHTHYLLADGSRDVTGNLVLDEGGTAAATINMGDVDASDDGAFWHNTKRASDHANSNRLIFAEYTGAVWHDWLWVEPSDGAAIFKRPQVAFQGGTASLPSIAQDTDLDTGIYFGNDIVNITAGGVLIASFNNFGSGNENFRVVNGSASRPSLSFISDVDIGFYRYQANEVGVATAGVVRWRFGSTTVAHSSLRPNVTASYNLGDWTYRWNQVAAVRILASNSASVSAPDFAFLNDLNTGMYLSGTDEIGLAANGSKVASFGTGTGVYLPGAYALTTGSAVNVRIMSTGFLYRSTSARKYKQRINYNVGYLADMELRPVKFYRKDDKAWYFGFVADDLAEEHPLLAEFEDGEVENYDMRAVIAVLAAKVNRLESERA